MESLTLEQAYFIAEITGVFAIVITLIILTGNYSPPIEGILLALAI